MAVEFADGVVIGADSRTTTGYIYVVILAYKNALRVLYYIPHYIIYYKDLKILM